MLVCPLRPQEGSNGGVEAGEEQAAADLELGLRSLELLCQGLPLLGAECGGEERCGEVLHGLGLLGQPGDCLCVHGAAGGEGQLQLLHGARHVSGDLLPGDLAPGGRGPSAQVG